jgi:hypothetical protein
MSAHRDPLPLTDALQVIESTAGMSKATKQALSKHALYVAMNPAVAQTPVQGPCHVLEDVYAALSSAAGIKIRKPSTATAFLKHIGLANCARSFSILTTKRRAAAHPGALQLHELMGALESLDPSVLAAHAEAFKAKAQADKGGSGSDAMSSPLLEPDAEAGSDGNSSTDRCAANHIVSGMHMPMQTLLSNALNEQLCGQIAEACADRVAALLIDSCSTQLGMIAGTPSRGEADESSAGDAGKALAATKDANGSSVVCQRLVAFSDARKQFQQQNDAPACQKSDLPGPASEKRDPPVPASRREAGLTPALSVEASTSLTAASEEYLTSYMRASEQRLNVQIASLAGSILAAEEAIHHACSGIQGLGTRLDAMQLKFDTSGNSEAVGLATIAQSVNLTHSQVASVHDYIVEDRLVDKCEVVFAKHVTNLLSHSGPGITDGTKASGSDALGHDTGNSARNIFRFGSAETTGEPFFTSDLLASIAGLVSGALEDQIDQRLGALEAAITRTPDRPAGTGQDTNEGDSCTMCKGAFDTLAHSLCSSFDSRCDGLHKHFDRLIACVQAAVDKENLASLPGFIQQMSSQIKMIAASTPASLGPHSHDGGTAEAQQLQFQTFLQAALDAHFDVVRGQLQNIETTTAAQHQSVVEQLQQTLASHLAEAAEYGCGTIKNAERCYEDAGIQSVHEHIDDSFANAAQHIDETVASLVESNRGILAVIQMLFGKGKGKK